MLLEYDLSNTNMAKKHDISLTKRSTQEVLFVLRWAIIMMNEPLPNKDNGKLDIEMHHFSFFFFFTAIYYVV